MKKSKTFWLFLLAIAVGLLDSLWLLGMHLNKGLQNGCSMNSFVNCSAINHPTYSQWWGMPVSFFSLLVYIGIALAVYMWLNSNNDSEKAKTQSFMSLLIWGSFAAMLYFAGITIFIIKAFCLYCSIFYLSSITMLLTWRLLKQSDHPRSVLGSVKAAFKSKSFMIWGLLCVLLLTIAKTAVFKESHQVAARVQNIQINDAIKQRTLGQASASITIVEYSDFQCPACKQAGETLKTLVRQSKGTMKLVYKFFPLDPACNDKMPPGRGHLMACQAAKGAICAGDQEQFWSYHDLVFAHQHKLDQDLILDFAKQLDFDMDKFKQCLNSETVHNTIVEDIKEGNALNLMHTPTIFINGREYNGSLTLSSLQTAIEAFE